MMNPKGSCKAAFLVQINNIEFLTLTFMQRCLNLSKTCHG